MLKIFKALLVMSCLAQSVFAGGEAGVGPLTLACSRENDLFKVLKANGFRLERYSTPALAIAAAKTKSALLLLAEEYPSKPLEVSEQLFRQAAEKNLRVYIEFPSFVPGIELGQPCKEAWERLVISSEEFGPALPKTRIMMANESYVQPCTAQNPMVVAARVAGYDTAVFGIPATAHPVLFAVDDGRVLVATTKLSGFVTGRFAPTREWGALWSHIISKLSGAEVSQLQWEPLVTAMYGPKVRLPDDFERTAFRRFAQWVYDSHLLVTESRWPAVQETLKSLNPNNEAAPVSEAGDQIGDGRFGILEGYSSRIGHDGQQMLRRPIRADCQAETAMAMALDWKANMNRTSRTTASNLLDFLYYRSDMCGGARGNPKHPSFGLISWGSITPSWTVANYGDDNARVMLATMLASACLDSERWDEPLLKALHANLRTTGKLGFQSDRIDMPELEANGWRHYHEKETVNYSPPFEALNWACYLWAYRQTREREFLETPKKGIRMMMDAFPDKWRWDDSTERARMVLCLAWLVRVEDTEEHRRWLHTMVDDIIRTQDKTGAIPERFRGAKGSHFRIPESNEAYGTAESPLLQRNGDPVTDQLYNSGFVLMGLHEAAAALKDLRIRAAEDKLAEYLCRIQIRSKAFPYLNGNWFRAFDYERWEPWASSGDSGWGAWSVEAGWAQAWTAGTLGLRLQETTLWDLTKGSQIRMKLPKVREQMAQNAGEPWRPAAAVKTQ
jgi:hypothetical protein